jgi:hypothetical protein
MTRASFKKPEALLAGAIILLALFIGFHQHSGDSRTVARENVSLNYLPSGTFLKGLSLGFDEALADLLWVRTVGYFGEHVKTDRQYTWLVHMLKLIIALDPRYESPYEFAAVILPTELGDADTAIDILKKGVENVPRHHPRYWLQPFYLGFCYLVYKNEPLEAARYFELAATFPQRPPYLPLLVSRIHASQNRPEVGYATLQSLLDDPKNEALQDSRARESLILRQKELVVALHIQMLERAVADYRGLTGQMPGQLSELVDALILPFIPAEPFGGRYYLAWEGDEVRSSLTEGKFRVYGSHKQRMSILKPRQQEISR